MKKILIFIIVIAGLSIPFINYGHCFGAVGPENPTGEQCAIEKVSIIGFVWREL